MTTRNDSELQRLSGSEDTVYTLHGNINMAHKKLQYESSIHCLTFVNTTLMRASDQLIQTTSPKGLSYKQKKVCR